MKVLAIAFVAAGAVLGTAAAPVGSMTYGGDHGPSIADWLRQAAAGLTELAGRLSDPIGPSNDSCGPDGCPDGRGDGEDVVPECVRDCVMAVDPNSFSSRASYCSHLEAACDTSGCVADVAGHIADYLRHRCIDETEQHGRPETPALNDAASPDEDDIAAGLCKSDTDCGAGEICVGIGICVPEAESNVQRLAHEGAAGGLGSIDAVRPLGAAASSNDGQGKPPPASRPKAPPASRPTAPPASRPTVPPNGRCKIQEDCPPGYQCEPVSTRDTWLRACRPKPTPSPSVPAPPWPAPRQGLAHGAAAGLGSIDTVRPLGAAASSDEDDITAGLCKSDADCGAGEICVGIGICVPEADSAVQRLGLAAAGWLGFEKHFPKPRSCSSDDDCGDDEFCLKCGGYGDCVPKADSAVQVPRC